MHLVLLHLLASRDLLEISIKMPTMSNLVLSVFTVVALDIMPIIVWQGNVVYLQFGLLQHLFDQHLLRGRWSSLIQLRLMVV